MTFPANVTLLTRQLEEAQKENEALKQRLQSAERLHEAAKELFKAKRNHYHETGNGACPGCREWDQAEVEAAYLALGGKL